MMAEAVGRSIAATSAIIARVARDGEGGGALWCILRTAGPRTLSLVRSLDAAGIDAWTPTKKVASRLSRHRKPAVVDTPILPTFVFAAADRLIDLFAALAAPINPHPAFSIFHCGERVPLVGEAQIDGLRQIEREEADIYQGHLDALDREERRQARIADLKTERARRKALRAERRDFEPGTRVDVADMPALAGLHGAIVDTDGTSAVVHFGGNLTMKIEAWRLSPHRVDGGP